MFVGKEHRVEILKINAIVNRRKQEKNGLLPLEQKRA